MDAFSVSLVNGLREPDMPKGRMAQIAGVFGGFQLLMPMIGWICVRTILEIFQSLTKYIPWVAFGLLLFIGGKMVVEGIRNREGQEAEQIGTGGLLMQGVATSIDALSVGLTMTDLNWIQALAESTLIGIVTFGICMGGILIGRKAGTKLSNKAGILGGLVLIAIGVKILVSGG
ncbi:MAG: manganese efflux pump [Clostridia bacterium]|nr:manganese efflux pump [Clostridia bacterium]